MARIVWMTDRPEAQGRLLLADAFQSIWMAALRLVVLGFALTLVPFAADAQSLLYHAYLETDQRSSTGCNVVAASGERFDGVEFRISLTVSGAPPLVTSQSIAQCIGNDFGAGNAIAANYPVGLNIGLPRPGGLSDVIELAVARADLPGAQGAVRVGYASEHGVGTGDALFTRDGGSNGPPIVLGLPQVVPTLGLFAALVLALSLSVLALRVLRHNRHLGQLLLVGAFLSTGLAAWAADFIADGRVGDWGDALPAGMDALGDSVPELAATDIVGAFAAEENRRLYFRIDVVDVENGAPLAVDDGYEALEDVPLGVPAPGVLANDSDPEGDGLVAQLLASPGRGMLVLNADGSFVYTPGADFNGSDSFTYRTFDGLAASPGAATVTLAISPVNDAPAVTASDPPAVDEDSSAQAVAGWAGFDPGPPDEAGQTALGYQVGTVGNPALFAVPPAVAGDGTLTYAAAADAHGSSSFTLRVQDSGGSENGGVDLSALQTFTITVAAVNDAPVLALPGAQQSADTVPLVFAAANGNAISLADVDAGAGIVQLSFDTGAAANGTLSLANPDGVLASLAGNGSERVVASGTLAALNAALNGPSGNLTYTPAMGTSAVRTIAVAANDQGHSGSGGALVAAGTLAVSIDAAPQLASTPADGARIANDAAIAVDFSELVNVGNGIALACGGANLITGGATGVGVRTLSLAYAAPLPAGPCTLTVPLASVSDVDAIDPPDHPLASYSASFIVDAAPAVAATAPAGGATTASDIAFVVDFSEPVTFDAQSFALECPAGTPFAGGLAVDGSGTPRASIDPVGELPSGACALTVIAANVRDADALDPPDSMANNTVVNFSVDAAPAMVAAVPAPAAVVATGQAVSFSFDENVVDLGGAITLDCAGAVPGAIGGSGSPTLTLTPSLPLPPGASCTATAVAAQIGDSDGFDPPQGPPADMLRSFSVDALPVVTATSPVDAAVDVPLSGVVVFEFSENVDFQESSFAYNCAGVVAFMASGSGTHRATLTPTSSLPVNTPCTVTALGSVSDSDVIDPPDGLPATSISFVTVNDFAPQVESTTPAADAGVSGDIQISVRFDEPVNTSSGSVSLSCNGGSNLITGGTAATAVVQLTPSHASIPPGPCVLTIHADRVRDADALDPPDVMAADHVVNFLRFGPPSFLSLAPTHTPEQAAYDYPVTLDTQYTAPPVVLSVEQGPNGSSMLADGSTLRIPADALQPVAGVLAANPWCRSPIALASPARIDMVERWYYSSEAVLSVMLVGRIMDRNADGIIDDRDPPTILAQVWPKHGSIEQAHSRLQFVDGATGRSLWTIPNVLSRAHSQPAYADLDGDGTPEFLIVRPDDSVAAVTFDGDLLWSNLPDGYANGFHQGGIEIADFESDGTPEILVRGTAIDASGSTLWTAPEFIGTSSTPVFFRTEEGAGRVVMGHQVLDTQGNLLWQIGNSVLSGGGIAHAVADFNGDGKPEILTSMKTPDWHIATLALHDANGNEIWNLPMQYGESSPPTIADLDGDGRPEFVIAALTRAVAYDGDGNPLWEVPLDNTGSDSVAAAAFDFNGDGRMEVVLTDHTQLLVIDGITGSILRSQWHASRTANEYPVIADIDGDERADMLVSSDGYILAGIRAYTGAQPWARTLPRWNQFNYSITQGDGPEFDPAESGIFWRLNPRYRVNALLEDNPDRLLADLVVHDVRLAASPDRVIATVLNRGLLPASDAVVQFRSGNGPGSALIGTVQVPELLSGQSQDVEVALAQTPDDNVLVQVAAGAGTVECAIDNNQATGLLVRLRAQAADGQAARQSWLLNVDQVNHAPTIPAQTIVDAPTGDRLRYHVTATDPDLGDALRFDLGPAPEGMIIHPVSGELTWVPKLSDLGMVTVTVTVRDLGGLSATRELNLAVVANSSNLPPVFTSVPPTRVLFDQSNPVYQIQAFDPEGEALTYELVQAPAEVGFNAELARVYFPYLQHQPTPVYWDVVVRARDPRGAFTDQAFTVMLMNNASPEITSTPRLAIRPGSPYVYNVTATDANGDPIGYSLGRAPTGASIDSHTGQLTWVPTLAQVGVHQFLVWAADPYGGVAQQPFTVSVTGDNLPPTISSTPPVVAKAGREYRYDVDASDPDSLILNYSLQDSPPGMTIDATSGLIRWTPGAAGTTNVVVRVDDSESFVEQGWAIEVADADEALAVHLTVHPPISVLAGAPVSVSLSVTGAAGQYTLDLQRTTCGTNCSIPLDAQANATVTADEFGRQLLLATVTDDYDTATDTGEFFVIDPSDTTAPVVDILSPIDNAEVTSPTPVRVTVSDARLRDWQIYFRESNTDGPPTLLAEGNFELADAVAATFDPTTILNGLYTVYLVAADMGGNISTDSVVLRVTGDMKIGNFSLTFEEVSIPVAGIPVTVSRTYDTRRRNEDLDFGKGWSIDYQNVRVHESMKLGFSWFIEQVQNGTFSNFCNRSNGDRIVTVNLPDGSVESFRAVVEPGCNPLIPEPNVTLHFEPIDGTDSTLEQTTYGLLRLQTIAGFPGMMTLIDPNGAEAPVDPSQYVLTLPDGLKYELDQDFGIRRVIDLIGNTLSYSDDGVLHSAGIGVDFERDATGRIVALVLPDGERIEYDYSPAGDLLAARDVLDAATRFEYANPRAPHYLTRITDARNLPVVRNEYDDGGRLISTTDAGGMRIEFTRDIGGRLERVKDRRGSVTTYIYDDSGRVLTETNTLGETISRSYDDDGNVLTETDPLGRTRSMTYDVRGNLLTETNALGATTTSTFNSRNALLTQVDALGRTALSNTYNPLSGALLTTADALGQQTTFGYDFGIGAGTQTGELKSITDALGRTTNYGLDVAGRGWRVVEVDAAGAITRYGHDSMGRVRTETRRRTLADGSSVDEVTTTSYDAKGRVVRVDHPDGSFSSTEYNAIDKPIRECDALSRCTETTYTERGEVARVTFPDGSLEETGYDANGNVIAQRDRGGRTTRMVYDAANRLIETIHPDAIPASGDDGNPDNNPRTHNQYDAAGQLRFVINERGHLTEYRYDSAGRQTQVIDAHGNATTTDYDAAGQRLSVTDAAGQVTRFEYDATGRLMATVHPDETPGSDTDNPRTTVEYDAAGQKVAAIDEMGRITRFAFDEVGRLAGVVLPNPATGDNPPLVNGQSPTGAGTLTTRYVYDERGNKTQQVDALGRITRFEYDAMGRQTARQLPLGQRESISYNAAGEQTGRQTFNGDAIATAYDGVGRPLTVSLPDRTRSFSYTTSGQVSEIVDGSDLWVFEYDARDRLVRAEDAARRSITFSYDFAGNRTGLQTCAPAGPTCGERQQIEYGYDELNRLAAVSARLDGGVPQTTQYRYSVVGTRSGMMHPNGTVVDYTYDVRNRLKTLVHKASDVAGAAILLALSYSVDASGLRTQIAEAREGDADTPTYTRTTDYLYDAVQRLVGEQVSGNHGNPDRVHSWTYDAVGNRLIQVATVGAASVATTTTTTYAYDANDRLLSESATTGSNPAVTTTSSYDNAGNLTETHEGASTIAQYTWDAEGRLVAAVTGAGPTAKSIAYRYDPNGIRRSQQVTDASGGVTRTEYLVDPNQAYAQVLEEWTATAATGPLPDETLATTYVYGDDLISQTKLVLASASVTSVYHYDGLGTTRALSAYKVDAAGVPQAGHGEITDRYAYTAFGEADPAGTSGDSSGSTENNYRYTGEQLDPNLGFYYLRSRYMDPSQGRFLGMDLASGRESYPSSLHKYQYADQQVANVIDPSGRSSIAELSTAQLGQGILSATNVASRVLQVYGRINSIIDLIYGLRQIPALLDGGLAINPADAISSIGEFATKQFFEDARMSLTKNIGRIMASGAINWTAGYSGMFARGGRIRKWYIEMPKFVYGAPIVDVPTGIRINRVPVELTFGGRNHHTGRLIGIGLNMNGRRTLFQQHYHTGHDPNSSDITQIADGQFHFHVKQWANQGP